MSRSGKSVGIVVFNDQTGDLITLGKRGNRYMNQVKESGNMGTAGGTLQDTSIQNSSNEKLYRKFYE